MATMRIERGQGAAERGFRAYQISRSVFLHFKDGSDYDAFRYNFSTSSGRSSYSSRNDRYHYEKIGKKYPDDRDLRYFFLANTLAGNTWIGSMDDQSYTDWIARIQSLTYRFGQEIRAMKRIADTYEYGFDDLLKPTVENPFSLFLDKYVAGDVSLETVTCIDILVGFITRLERVVGSDPLGLFSSSAHLVKKYEPFIAPMIDRDKLRSVVIKTFTK